MKNLSTRVMAFVAALGVAGRLGAAERPRSIAETYAGPAGRIVGAEMVQGKST